MLRNIVKNIYYQTKAQIVKIKECLIKLNKTYSPWKLMKSSYRKIGVLQMKFNKADNCFPTSSINVFIMVSGAFVNESTVGAITCQGRLLQP